MPFDSRVAGAMLRLGYRIFPFEAYDGAGNLLVPDSVDFPPDVNTELGKIAVNPLWKDLYRTMSRLRRDDRVFMAGIGFVNDWIQICLCKGTGTVANANEAMNWADSYHGTVEETMYRYAGRSYLVDPIWRSIIDRARSSLPSAELDVDASSTDSDFGTGDDDAPGPDSVRVTNSIPWLRLGLDLLADVVTRSTVRTRVLTTVVWYPRSHADEAFASRWRPIHGNWQKGWLSGHRTAHLIWNPVGLPVTWRSIHVAWKGPGMDMPHEPFSWCQALRPLANCLNRPTVSKELGIVDSPPGEDLRQTPMAEVSKSS